MSADGHGTKCRRKIAENYNRLSRVHERYRQTTDGRATATFAKKPLLLPRGSGCMRSIVTSMSVCGSVRLSARISQEPHARSLPVLCVLPMSVARSSSGMFTIGRIACRRDVGDGSAQRRRSVIYDCLVFKVAIYGRPM